MKKRCNRSFRKHQADKLYFFGVSARYRATKDAKRTEGMSEGLFAKLKRMTKEAENDK